MSGPVFATRWDFLHSTVLIGIDRSTGVFSGTEPTPGQQLVCVWTSDDIANDALHVESWEIRKIAMRDLLRLLPAGVGIVVDPERPTGMTASAAYVAALRPYLEPFPADVQVRVGEWPQLTGDARAAVVGAVSDLDVVRELHAFAYAVDDGPLLGCLAHVSIASPHDLDAVTRALEAATSDLAALGVAAVTVVSLDDVPTEIRAANRDQRLIHRRRRSRPWRR